MADETPKYRGDEPALALDKTPTVGEVYCVRAPDVPPKAVPLYDEESGAVIGYQEESVTGVFRLYDLDGNQIGMYETPLETPWFDPIDLIFILGSVVQVLEKGIVRGAGKAVARGAGETIGKFSIRALSAALLASLRATFRRVAVEDLKFTATTLARMQNPARYVPRHILRLAIKYGEKAADPQNVEGAVEYTVKMWKAVKPQYPGQEIVGEKMKEYTLKVVVRVKDWTVLHFHYL
jgi:hypothetical protein